MIVARTDWSPDATYVTFKAGDNYWSHVHLDQGAFTIYKGGALAIDSGLYGPRYGSDHHMNYAYQTIAHNTITVTDPNDTVPVPGPHEPRPIANDGGQRRVGSGWGVEAAPIDLGEWEAKREIYHTGTVEKVFDQDGVTVVLADVTAVVKLRPDMGEPGAWRVEVSPRKEEKDDVFLVVLMPALGEAVPPHRVRRIEAEGRVGCEIVGPHRTTRWWFETGRNGAEVEVIAGTNRRRYRIDSPPDATVSLLDRLQNQVNKWLH